MGYLGKEAVISNVIPPMISNSVKMLPLILSLLGALMAFLIYARVTRKGMNTRNRYLHIAYTFFNSAWQFNYVINHFIVGNV